MTGKPFMACFLVCLFAFANKHFILTGLDKIQSHTIQIQIIVASVRLSVWRIGEEREGNKEVSDSMNNIDMISHIFIVTNDRK